MRTKLEAFHYDFVSQVFQWCKKNLGEFPEGERIEKLWERLNLKDYTERLFMLCRDDVINEAENLGIEIPRESLEDPIFWDKIQKGIEFGFEFWTEVVGTALREAIDSKVKECEHNWQVYSTSVASDETNVPCILVSCKNCDAEGEVQDFSHTEWEMAWSTPVRFYDWADSERVININTGRAEEGIYSSGMKSRN